MAYLAAARRLPYISSYACVRSSPYGRIQRWNEPQRRLFFRWGGKSGGDPSSETSLSAPGQDENSNLGQASGSSTRGSSGGILQPMVGEDAPRPRTVIALPLMRRPMFPTHVQQATVQQKDVLEAIIRERSEGPTYIGVFLRKDSPMGSGWSSGTQGSGAHSGAGDVMLETDIEKPPEIITDLSQLYHVGCLAQVHNIMPMGNGEFGQLLLQAHRRISIASVEAYGPPTILTINHLPNGDAFDATSDVVRAYCQELLATIKEVVRLNPMLRERLTFLSRDVGMEDPFKLADFAAAITTADGHRLQLVLQEMNVEERLRMALELLSKEREVSRVQREIQRQVEEKVTKHQRNFLLMEQLRAIKKELGIDADDKDSLVNTFKTRIAAFTDLSKEAKKAMDEELNKLSALEKNSPEFNSTRNYLEWLTQLPWGKASLENYDLKKAQKVLDEDHYGLDDVKQRILEFVAVGKLRNGVHGKILCFVGPPGVGKTSLGQSIARALNREFYRFSVGGLTDVAEIKGHRRTYVGAMPGKLIQALKAVHTVNPLILIDEIDKLGKGYQGDPASALLEVLDPSQNSAFVDHYLDVPVDLSKVLFICTANVLDTIPGPLRDRMEIIWLSGYDLPEKVSIAEQYLIPKALQEGGLDKDVPESLKITTGAVESLIRWYCREAGVRSLQQQINKVVRKLALMLVRDSESKNMNAEQPKSSTESASADAPKSSAEDTGTANPLADTARDIKDLAKDLKDTVQDIKDTIRDLTSSPKQESSPEKDPPKEHSSEESSPKESSVKEIPPEDWVVTAENIEKFVGKRVFDSDRLYEEVTPPGVVMGLAWTAMGGTSLYIETSALTPQYKNNKTTNVHSMQNDINIDTENKGEGTPDRGAGGLRCTGQMGGVMSESASIAHHLARKTLKRVRQTGPGGLTFFDTASVHLHVPEGATPKDGPSAGVTMVTSLLSLALARPVRNDLAMTGEVSLTGKVLRVGGIKEKTIAARRAGVKIVVFPAGNSRDYEELPTYLKDGLEVKFAKTYDDVYAVAFGEELTGPEWVHKPEVAVQPQ